VNTRALQKWQNYVHELLGIPPIFAKYVAASHGISYRIVSYRIVYADLHVGNYVRQNLSKCDDLCAERLSCCDDTATCGCGTHTGFYECICPAGYYGSGLRHECFRTYARVLLGCANAG